MSAVSVLGLAILAGTLTRASAQAPGIPNQSDAPGSQLPQGASLSGLRGGVGSADAAGKAEEPPTSAERIIDEAAAKLIKLKSVSATLLETIDMLNHQIKIRGSFLKAPEQRIYLRLDVSGPPDTSGTTLQVCDGETLWDYQAILEVPQAYRKFSVKPIMERLSSPDLDTKIKEQAINQLGLAGPEWHTSLDLARGLEKPTGLDLARWTVGQSNRASTAIYTKRCLVVYREGKWLAV